MMDGFVHLKTKRITTRVLLEEIDPDSRPAAVAAVDEQMESFIFPQLRLLRRNNIGSVDLGLPVFPRSVHTVVTDGLRSE